MAEFNPNEAAIKNGNYFGFPYTTEEADIVLVSIPWDVTTSYKPGTSNGPEAMIGASVQLDFFDFDLEEAWNTKIATLPIEESIKHENAHYRKLAGVVIEQLEGGHANPEIVRNNLEQVNQGSKALNQKVYETTLALLKQDKIIGLVGGDHSTPLGYMQALSKLHDNFGILHIDAHADLRFAYEGFEFSHASIMNNALKIKSVSKLVQVGIRDFCDEEMQLAQSDKRIRQFHDLKLAEQLFEGACWDELCNDIVASLPEKVYISFDIDGLSPEYCPNTGTPVPGGLSYNQAIHLLRKVAKSGKQIIGFDLNEVAPGNNEWDANVGSRVLFKLCCLAVACKP